MIPDYQSAVKKLIERCRENELPEYPILIRESAGDEPGEFVVVADRSELNLPAFYIYCDSTGGEVYERAILYGCEPHS